jgi:transcriptional regulator with XRE-family HTH domain
MAQRALLVTELKQLLKERGITYSAVARKLKLSHASVKRLFSRGDFSLQRVDEICELAGMELTDLTERMRERDAPASKLTLEQERQIVSDPRLLLVAWLVLNKWRFEEIVKFYRFTEREALSYLIKLDRLKLIELQPGNRVRLRVSRNLTWRPGGPMQRYVHQVLLKEFFASDFSDPQAEFCFYAAEMSESVMTQARRALQNALKECMEQAERDLALPIGQRTGAVCVLAFRPLQFSAFSEFRRQPA